MTDDPAPPVDPHTQRATVRDGYDDPALADAYREQREATDPPGADRVDGLAASLDDGARVVDVGCGQGVPVLTRLPAGVDGVGVDLSATMLATARDRTDAGLVRGDATRLPVADGVADAVTAFHSLIHVPVADHPEVYAEFARVLRPGGRLLLTAATGGDGWSGANPDWLGSGATMAWSFPGLDRTRDHLGDAGFRVDDERVVAETVADEDGDGGSWTLLTAAFVGE